MNNIIKLHFCGKNINLLNVNILNIPQYVSHCFFLNEFICLKNFFYFWLCWVFIAARRLSLVVVSGGYSSLQCAGFSLRWLLLLRSTGPRHVGFSSCGTWASAVVACGLSSCGS